MFQNTGTISFTLYSVFILITLIALFTALFYIKKGYDIIKLEKMIDLFKYSIASIGIATVTLIISDLYKEREQQLKELEYFDKYADDIKKVDGIALRYELTKYLSIVAPDGEIKKSWGRYYDTLKIEYQEYLKSKNEKQSLDSIKSPTSLEITKKRQIIDKIQQKNLPLVPDIITNKPIECFFNLYFGNKKQRLELDEKNVRIHFQPLDGPKRETTSIVYNDPYYSVYLLPGSYNCRIEIMSKSIKMEKKIFNENLKKIVVTKSSPQVFDLIIN